MGVPTAIQHVCLYVLKSYHIQYPCIAHISAPLEWKCTSYRHVCKYLHLNHWNLHEQSHAFGSYVAKLQMYCITCIYLYIYAQYVHIICSSCLPNVDIPACIIYIYICVYKVCESPIWHDLPLLQHKHPAAPATVDFPSCHTHLRCRGRVHPDSQCYLVGGCCSPHRPWWCVSQPSIVPKGWEISQRHDCSDITYFSPYHSPTGILR